MRDAKPVILIIDDDITITRFTMKVLQRLNVDTISAQNGEIGLQQAKHARPNVILLDMMMPGMDGLETCRHLKADPDTKDIPVIFMTALKTIDDKAQGFEAGGIDYITKPIQYKEMLARVDIHLTIQQLREHLRQSESCYRAIVEDQPELVCRFLPDGTLTFVNDAYCRYFAEEPEQLLGSQFLARIPGQDRENITTRLAMLEKTHPVATIEHGVIRSGGDIRWHQWVYHRISGEHDRFTEVQAVGRDVTEQKQSESRLRESEANVRTILDSSRQAFILIDPEYRIQALNAIARKDAEQMLGKEITRGDTLEKLIPAYGLDSADQCFSQALGGESSRIETHISGKDARPHWFDVCLNPVTTKEGQIVGICLSVSDITKRKQTEAELAEYREHLEELVQDRTAELTRLNERLQREIGEHKQTEQALRTSEQQYRLLAENVADGVVILQHGKLVLVNTPLANMLKYPAEQLIGTRVSDLFACEDQQEHERQLQQLLQGQIDSFSCEQRCAAGDQQELWVEILYAPILWMGQSAILLTVRDITERKQHELVMVQKQAQLEQENITLKATIKDRYRFGKIIGKSPAMQQVYELVVQAAATNANVVICGETGVGKELVAQTIHHLSERREKAFVAVNCGAVTETLFEREFFGHRKGAFTGADRDKPGYVGIAHNGTLFLDEVGELNLAMQVKLLRTIEYGEYTPVGDHGLKPALLRSPWNTQRAKKKKPPPC